MQNTGFFWRALALLALLLLSRFVTQAQHAGIGTAAQPTAAGPSATQRQGGPT